MIDPSFFFVFYLGIAAGIVIGGVLVTPKFTYTTSLDDRLQQAEQHYPLDAAQHILADYCNNLTFHDPEYACTDWGPRTGEEILEWLHVFSDMLKTRKSVIVQP